MQLAPRLKSLSVTLGRLQNQDKGKKHTQPTQAAPPPVCSSPTRQSGLQAREEGAQGSLLAGKRRGNAFRPDHRALRRPTHKQPRAVMEKMFAFTGNLAFPNFYKP